MKNIKDSKGRELRSRILIENWNGDLHLDIQGSFENIVKSLTAYILQFPHAIESIEAAIELASMLAKDKDFQKDIKRNTVLKEYKVQKIK